MSTKIEEFTFEVVPADPDHDTFEPFLLDVPTLMGEEAAARRAYMTAFTMLGRRGIEPEEFAVHVWKNGAPGDLVTIKGIVRI